MQKKKFYLIIASPFGNLSPIIILGGGFQFKKLNQYLLKEFRTGSVKKNPPGGFFSLFEKKILGESGFVFLGQRGGGFVCMGLDGGLWGRVRTQGGFFWDLLIFFGGCVEMFSWGCGGGGDLDMLVGIRLYRGEGFDNNLFLDSLGLDFLDILVGFLFVVTWLVILNCSVLFVGGGGVIFSRMLVGKRYVDFEFISDSGRTSVFRTGLRYEGVYLKLNRDYSSRAD